MLYSTIPQHNEGLWEHQKNAKGDILKAWDRYDSLMLQMPTGTGKTFLFTSLVSDLLQYYKGNHIELNILLVVHRLELIEQISASLSRYGIPHGFIQGNREQHLWQRIQVGSIMSLLTEKNEANVQRLDFDYIIVDEAHHSLSDTYKRLFEMFPRAKKLGVTATPWRFNHETFTTLYDELITTPQIKWFIDHNVLSDFDYVSIKPDSELQQMIDNTEIAETGDFVNAELDSAFNNQRIRAKLFQSYRNFANGRKGIIYAINREHAQNIVALYCSEGVKAVAIDCETPKDVRRQMIEDFKAGHIQVLVNVEIFTEGFDCPDVSFIQLARPTRSLSLYIQQVGRGLRRSEGKQKAIILDNVGLYNYFGLPDANRHWRYHFIGHEAPNDLPERTGDLRELNPETESRERDYDEEDEEMMVVRGSKKKDADAVPMPANHEQTDEVITEFTLCDYYLVRGTSKRFKIYPLVKKRGKLTGGVTNCIYEYDEQQKAIRLGTNTQDNLLNINSSTKAKTILLFSASLCELTLREIADVRKLAQRTDAPLPQHISLWWVMKMIDKLYKK